MAPVRKRFSRALISSFVLVGLLISPVYCQTLADDFMHSTGKIYVVVAVIIVIFLVLIIYLFWMDRRLKKLEKQFRNGKIE